MVGGEIKFYPYKKGGEKHLSHAYMLKWEGGERSFWVVLTQELEVLAILKGGRQKFSPFKKRARIVLPCLGEGRQNVSDPQFSHFVAPPPPIIKDRSLFMYLYNRFAHSLFNPPGGQDRQYSHGMALPRVVSGSVARWRHLQTPGGDCQTPVHNAQK